MKQLFLFVSIVVLFSGVGFAKDDILTTAAANGSFNTLTSLVVAADLDEALQGKGDFTVFAPTDDAFAALPEGTLENLLAQEGREDLARILKYHVLPQRVTVPKTNPHPLKTAKTLLGEQVNFDRKGSEVKVNQARIVLRNIECTNGVIHVVDAVLLPPTKLGTIVDVAKEAGNFKTLLAAAKAAGLVDALAGEGPITVFAPTDEAFAGLPKGTLKSLLKSENRSELARILKYHVVAGKVGAEDAVRAGKAQTLAKKSLQFSIRNGRLTINESQVIDSDIETDNGVIHVIDRVLLPAPLRSNSESSVSENTSHRNIPKEIVITSDWDSPVVRDGVVAEQITIRVGGAGSVRLTNVEADRVVTSVSGGGALSISGVAKDHQVVVRGGATLRARNLETDLTDIQVNGGGTAEVNAKEKLIAKANAGATLRYVSTDAEISKSISKYGEFRKIH